MFCPCELKSSTLTKEDGTFYRELVFKFKAFGTIENPDASVDGEIRMKIKAEFAGETQFEVGDTFDFYPQRLTPLPPSE